MLKKVLLFLACTLSIGLAFTATAQIKTVQIGANAVGSVTDNGGGSITVVGGGNDIWDMTDEFTYAYTEATGDFDVAVRVESVSPNARWSKAGIMVRESLAEDARFVFVRVTPPDVPTSSGGNGANDTKLAYRTGAMDVAGESGGNHEDPTDQNIPPYPNAWIRLTRSGNVIAGHISADGTAWTQIASQDTGTGDWITPGAGGPLKKTALVGLAVSRHSGGPTATAEFRNLTINTPPFSLSEASSRGNPNAILVTFSSAPDAGQLDPLSYDVVPGVTIASVTPGPRPNTFWLIPDAGTPLVEGNAYTVTIFGVTAGGNAPANSVDTFVHGGGYEARGIHVGHNKEPSGNANTYIGRTSFQRGLFGTAEGDPSLEGGALDNGTPVFEDPIPDTGSNERFGTKIFGLLHVATAGDYRFAMSSDDIGHLYLSTDTKAANKRQIAEEPAWNGRREYVAGGNQGTRQNPPYSAANPANISQPISLAVGDYYMELVYSEGGGGNNGSATWKPAGQAFANGDIPIAETQFTPSRYFQGTERGFFFHNLGPISIANAAPPAATSVPENSTATFRMGLDGLDGTPAYQFQWQRQAPGGGAFANIPGATDPTYSFVAVRADNGAKFRVVVNNEFSSATSADAALTVTFDATPPTVLNAFGSGAGTSFDVSFSELINQADAETIGNYAISDGIALNSATLLADGKTVRISSSSIAGLACAATLTVNNIRDRATVPNTIAANSTVPVGYAKGSIRYLQYNGISGVNVSDLTGNPKFNTAPDLVRNETTSFEGPDHDGGNNLDNYGGQMVGYLTAPVTGLYTFYCASDDGSTFWLSTDDNPGNKVVVAREPIWSTFRSYTGDGGGGGGRGGANISVPIALQAGCKYYVEYIWKEGGGGDYGSIAWQTPPNGPHPDVPANGSAPIPATFLSPFEVAPTFRTQPQDVTTEEGRKVSYNVSVFGTAPLSLQWERSVAGGAFEAVPGANGFSLTTDHLIFPTDNGTKYRLVASNEFGVVISSVSTITVTDDTTGPTAVSASGTVDLNKVVVTFNEPVNMDDAQDGFNYVLSSGASISSAVLDASEMMVTLTVDPPLAADTAYTIDVSSVRDFSGNTLSPSPQTLSFRTYAVSLGFVVFEAYNGGTGTAVSELTSNPLFPDQPDTRAYIGGFNTRLIYPGDSREQYGGRLRGFFVPPTSGNWIFYLASDDASELRLNPTGTSSAAADLVLLTAETGCCNPFAAHASAPQALVAGQAYYIEALYKEGGGGDFCQVAAKLDTDTTAPNSLAPIGPASLASLADTVHATLSITRQPVDTVFILNPAGPSGSNAVFSVAATASGVLAYQWERDSGAGFVAIPGATGSSYSFLPTLANNGNKLRVQVFTPGKTTTSETATLTVVQPNTPPTFTGSGDVSSAEDTPNTVPGWAHDISVHSIARSVIHYGGDFTTLPAGSTLSGNAAIDGGILKLTSAINSQQGFWATPAVSGLIESFTATFKVLVGGGTCCGDRTADGWTLSYGNDIPVGSYTAEEGGGSGLIVDFDSWDNGGADDAPNAGVKSGGTVVAVQSLDGIREGGRPPTTPLINDPATGLPMTYKTGTDFTTVRIHLDPDGTVDVDFKNVRVLDNIQSGIHSMANPSIVFAARTGGANDNHWIDDLVIEAFPVDSSSAENGQTVSFLVSNDNPSLFSSQPAIAPDGTLTYTPAPNACGSANVSVRAKDNGGTAYGGNDTSAETNFKITITPVNDAPSGVNQTVTVRNCGQSTIALGATDPDDGGCGALPSGISITTPPSHGSLAPGGTAFTVLYTPAANYLGPDSFSYTVTDGALVSAPATITINVTTCNQAPTAKITADGLVDFGSAVPHKLLISGNGEEACTVLDGSLSSDPDGDPLTYAWFDLPSVTPFGTTVTVTNCFDLGEHIVLLEVTDPLGAKGSDSITFDVVTASEAIDVLINDINDSNIARKNKRPFIATLKAASAAADRGSNGAAANQLHALQNKIRAQVARDNPTEAERWIGWAQDIIDALL